MDKERLEYLHQQYINDQMSLDEFNDWKAAVSDPDADDSIKNLMDANWDFMDDKKLKDLQGSKSVTIYETLISKPRNNKPRTLWARVSVVAAVVSLSVLAVYFFQQKGFFNVDRHLTAQDIAPGSVGATLTLANGKKIRLSDAVKGELAREEGVAISKSEEGVVIYEVKTRTKGLSEYDLGATNILTTARGETYIVTLPDKSTVWLNAASSLTYSASLLEHGKRKVKLEGEAYFEIAKDEKHPFIVETNKQEVEVLGTQFNINSYPDEEAVKTTLLEGSVRITIDAAVKGILKPGQQGIVKADKLRIVSADLETEMAWKNGFFRFNDEKLESIMRKVSRWYNTEVIYEDEALKSEPFAGVTARFSNVSELLRMLELTGEVRFKINGRQISVLNAK